MAKEYTDSNFQTDVLASDKLTVVDFWAEWCGPCRAIGPVIEELSKEYDGKVNVGKVNVDVNPQVSMNYGITSIPAILFIKNGCWQNVFSIWTKHNGISHTIFNQLQTH